MADDTQQALWNFDGAELFLIFKLKESTVYAMENWDLDEAYKKMRLLRMELDAKLARGNIKIIREFEDEIEEAKKNKRKEPKKTEKKVVDEMLIVLDNAYTELRNNVNPDATDKSKFYQELEKFYMHLCYIMKKHGLYFREGEDMRLAVLRR